MAHTHEHTLLAKLGFADQDRNDPLHDLGCRYLALPANSLALAKILLDGAGPEEEDGTVMMTNGSVRSYKRITSCEAISARDSVTEFPLTKGGERYKTVVGFLDVLIFADKHMVYDEVLGSSEDHKTGRYKSCVALVVEVKATRASIGDVLRQLNLYREFLRELPAREHRCVLATMYDVAQDEVDLLKKQGVFHVRLGKKFQQYVEERKVQDGASSASTEI